MGLPRYLAHTLVMIDCYLCGTSFSMEPDLYNQRLKDHLNFWCPNGHDQHFLGPTEADRLREQLADKDRVIAAKNAEVERERRSRQWAESRTKGANIKAGKALAAQRRLEHRVMCGVCPKCHRTFKQLAAHMKSKHSAS